MKQLILLIIPALIAFSSCKNNDSDDTIVPSPVATRTLSYEATGTYTGALYASYTTASGGTVNEIITSLPWMKEITFEANVTASNIAISGNGGAANQMVTLVIRRGSSQLSTTSMTADGSGSFSKAAPVVIF